MVLVTYSDSGTDSEPELPTPSATSKGNTSPQCIPATNPSSQSRKRKADDLLDQSNTQKTLPPPLPRSLHSLYATNVRTGISDDPSLHGGRKRQVVHVQGNWPSHVYLEWYPSKTQLHRLDTIIANIQTILHRTRNSNQNDTNDITIPLQTSPVQLHSFLRSPLSAQLPLHISLSAPLVLHTSNKDDFHAELCQAINAAHVGVIDVQLTSLDLVPNFEKSRYFLVTRLDAQSHKKLGELLRVCNGICERFGLPKLYQGPSHGSGVGDEAVGVEMGSRIRSERGPDADKGEDVKVSTVDPGERLNPFHISIAWMLTEVQETVRREIQLVSLEGVEKDTVRFEQIKVKIGNVIDDVLL